jgi:hypothetical protein
MTVLVLLLLSSVLLGWWAKSVLVGLAFWLIVCALVDLVREEGAHYRNVLREIARELRRRK